MTKSFLRTDVPTDLLWHQKECFRFFETMKSGAMFIPTGLGKTRSVLTILAHRGEEKIIFVTKKNILFKISDEIEKWTTYSWQVLSAKTKNKPLTEQVVIVNYDILASVKKKLIEYGANVIVLDESHCIKTPAALRTKCAFEIRDGFIRELRGGRKVPVAYGQQIPSRFLLTGTSIAKGFEDWWSQYKFIDDKIMPQYVTAYRALYCPVVMTALRGGGRMYPKALGYTNITSSHSPDIPCLMDRVRPWTFSVKKEDCLDLPPKMYDVVPLEMTDQIRAHYIQMKNESLVETPDIQAQASVYIARINKLHQIANGFVIDENGEHKRIGGENPKMEWLKEWLPDIIEDDKVVLWTNYITTGEMLRETLEQMGVNFAFIKKGMTPDQMFEQNKRFQEDPSVRVMASAIKVGNSGIDLFAANWSVFVDCDDAYLDRSQAEDRIYRIGQTKHCKYVDLVMRGSVERAILDNLKGKKGLHDLSIDELSILAGKEQI